MAVAVAAPRHGPGPLRRRPRRPHPRLARDGRTRSAGRGLRGAGVLSMTSQTDIAIVGFAQTPAVSRADEAEVQLCLSVITEARESAKLTRKEIDFTCSGSSDYLSGGTFTFVANLSAVGAWPPISESHVAMDGAWALHEAWVRLTIGEDQTALPFSSGKSSTGELRALLAVHTPPSYLPPLPLAPHSPPPPPP